MQAGEHGPVYEPFKDQRLIAATICHEFKTYCIYHLTGASPSAVY